jgi:hypothetical protein
MKTEQTREAWNKGKLVGQRPPLKLKGHSAKDTTPCPV